MRDKRCEILKISPCYVSSPSVFLSQHIALCLPESLPIFELFVQETEDLPQVCVGVRTPPDKRDTSGKMHFDIIHLDDTPYSLPGVTNVDTFKLHSTVNIYNR